jgi:hypothetical protein
MPVPAHYYTDDFEGVMEVDHMAILKNGAMVFYRNDVMVLKDFAESHEKAKKALNCFYREQKLDLKPYLNPDSLPYVLPDVKSCRKGRRQSPSRRKTDPTSSIRSSDE